MLLHSQKISEWCWVSDPLIPLQVKAGGIARVMQLSDAETAPAHVFAARAAAVPRRWSIKLCLAFTFAASCVSALCKQELVCWSKTSRANSCCFFSQGFIALAARRSRVPVLAWQSQHEVHSTKSLCIGFIRLKELIGFPPEPCGGAGSLALRLGV